jgi:2-polyprenyl-6-methoxyphenol hydroxylase-like FAD-dependent oxidoreductase
MARAVGVSIIGGGIGGLAIAIALLGRGFEVNVYERAQALRPVGAGLTLSPNGLSSLEAIRPGLVDELKKAGSEVDRLTIRRSSGEMLMSQRVALTPKFGQPMLNIRWSRLQFIPASALPPDRVHLNHCDRPPLRQWSNGRVTLLGDAAHPIGPAPGQGANITFEDAYELAAYLASSPDIETALRAGCNPSSAPATRRVAG